jgi:tetratricopeptide (TPR) repeat protein
MKKRIGFIIIVIFLLIGLYFASKVVFKNAYNKGIVSYKAQNIIDAEKYFRISLVCKRNNKDALIYLAKTQFSLGKIKEAGSTVYRLSKIIPEGADYYALKGQLLIAKKEYKTALEYLNKAVLADSLLSNAYNFRGIAKANLNDLVGAASDYTKAQELDNTNIEALKNSTSLYIKLENYIAIIENYNKLLAMNPTNSEAYLQRGIFKMNIGEYKNAIIDFSKAIDLVPSLAEAYFNRGKSLAQNQNYLEAINDFGTSYSMNYKSSSSLYNSGLAWLKLQQPKKAKKCLEDCIAIDLNKDNTGNAIHLLGVIELMQNNYKNSIKYFSEALTKDSTIIDSYYNRAIAYGYLKDYQSALKDLNICIIKGKKTADVYFARGVQKISMNDFQNGCKDLTIAADMGYKQALEMKKSYCK